MEKDNLKIQAILEDIIKQRNKFMRKKDRISVTKLWWRIKKEQVQEMRCIQWTTYDNLNDWFTSFKFFCVEFGFAKEYDVSIPEEEREGYTYIFLKNRREE